MTGCLVKSGSHAPVSLLEIGHTCNQKSKGSTEELKLCSLSSSSCDIQVSTRGQCISVLLIGSLILWVNNFTMITRLNGLTLVADLITSYQVTEFTSKPFENNPKYYLKNNIPLFLIYIYRRLLLSVPFWFKATFCLTSLVLQLNSVTHRSCLEPSWKI